MTDVASLRIRVEDKEVKSADRSLEDLARSASKAERATDSFSAKFSKVAGIATAVTAAVQSSGRGLEAASKFQEISDQLETAAGSSALGRVEFARLDAIAREIAPTFDDVTQSFIKLKNLGLDPSREAIVSYGNTAAAMGKSLDQLIEAVADAATGEFERLKEFGIKSRSEGDRVTFTFQGVETTVQKSAEAIQGYLLDLGNTTFAGALERKNDNLRTSLGALGDAVDRFTARLADDIGLTAAAKGATDALNDMFNALAGGARPIEEATERLDALQKQMAGLGGDRQGLPSDIIVGFADSAIIDGGIENLQRAQDALRDFTRERIRLRDEALANAEDDGFLGLNESKAQAFADEIDGLIAKREEVAAAIQQIADNEAAAEQKLQDKKLASQRAAAEERAAQRQKEEEEQFARYEADVIQFEAYLERKRQADERLAERQKEIEISQIESIRLSLLTEEEAIEESYNRRRDLILGATEITESLRTDLVSRLGRERLDREETLEAQRRLVLVGNASDIFGELSEVTRAFAGEQSDVYKGLFAISKAFAIAESIVKIQQGIASAAALPFPANLPAMATVVASTAGIVSTIQSTNFEGAFDRGGMIPAGKFGVVGEFGPEIVNGPAIVQSRQSTADRISGTEPSRSGAVVVQMTNNYDFTNADESVVARLNQKAEEITQATMARLAQDGFESGPISQAIKYGG